jgi:hypothetical protein
MLTFYTDMIKIAIVLVLILLVRGQDNPSQEEVKIGLLHEFANFDQDGNGLLNNK